MLRGYIDSVTTLGYIEGWAFDTNEPNKALAVSVFMSDTEVAWGIAHRFRTDLMEAGYGVGWCAFRMRLSVMISDVQRKPLQLYDRLTGKEICTVSDIRLVHDPEVSQISEEGVLQGDPTLVSGVWQLKQCEQLFMSFIAEHRIDGFLSAAYAYMLGRPMDLDGLNLYTRCIRQATLTPVGVLMELEKSAEYHSRPRHLAAPSSAQFPFL